MVTDADARRQRRLDLLKRVGALLAIAALSVVIYALSKDIERFARFGYPGIFVFMLLNYATIILPGPGGAVVVVMGNVLNPLWVGVAAGAGAALGELSGYAAGYSGQTAIQNVRLYQRLHTWMQHSPRKTWWSLVALSALPNPAFDIAGIVAGALKVPLVRFLTALWIGETLKMLMFAYAGHYGISWITSLIER